MLRTLLEVFYRRNLAIAAYVGEGPESMLNRPRRRVPSVMCGRPRRSKGDLVCCAAVGCGHVSGLRCAAFGPLALMQFAAWSQTDLRAGMAHNA